ncbi:MAG: transporter [Lachnospiraceae bacterium]|nr:transporter [Lachnospiraceae bacterium]
MTKTVKKGKNFLLKLLLLLFVSYLLFAPAKALEGSKRGLLLWFHTILPTLLPFMIVSDLFMHTRIITKLIRPFSPVFRYFFGLSPYGTYAFLAGLLFGFPMGAKITADLYEMKKITGKEANCLLSIANNPSPVFLVTYVFQEELHLSFEIRSLLFLFYGSIFATVFLFGIYLKKETKNFSSFHSFAKKETSRLLSPGELIDVSIMNGFETIAKLGGYIILSSIAVSAVEFIPACLSYLKLLLYVTLELATGIHTIASLSAARDFKILLALCSCASGGICVLLQTYSVIRKTDLKIGSYLAGKLIQTCITAFFLFVLP